MTCAAGLTIGSGASVNINDGSLTVPNDIAINGTLTVGAGSVNVGGSWANNWTFTAGTGTVSFIDGTSQASISGANTFYNLKAVTTSGKQINFEAGKTQTVINSLTLQGASGNLLTLRSTVNGQQAVINLQNSGTRSITYVDVKDHSASGQYLAPGPPASFNSIDSGNNTRWFNPVSAVDSTPPANPSNLTAVSNPDGSISLSWTAPSDADLGGYNVYRDGTKINSQTVTTTSYKDSSVTIGSTYTYKVTSVDLAGNESSGVTRTATSTVQANTPPAAPSSLTATDAGTGGNVVLKWNREESFDIAGYVVAYKKTGNAVFEGIVSTGVRWNYAVTGLTNGSSYVFYVYAYDSNGNFSDPSSVTATPTNSGSTKRITPHPDPLPQGARELKKK